MRQSMWWLLLCALSFAGCSCAMHGTANEWNGLVGAAGDPVYLNTTSKVGFNLLVVLPFLGDTKLGGMVDEATRNIRRQGGDYVRVIQGSTENYWYGFPPFTWIVTPVISSLVVEYRPSEKTLLEQQRASPEPDLDTSARDGD
jgi:hypothetical protein